MEEVLTKAREITAVQRGQIIQRVLVDGWSPTETAATFGLEERLVVRWVAAYRRSGMASLRAVTAGEGTARGWVRWLRLAAAWLLSWVHRPVRPYLAPRVELRRRGDDGSSNRG